MLVDGRVLINKKIFNEYFKVVSSKIEDDYLKIVVRDTRTNKDTTIINHKMLRYVHS